MKFVITEKDKFADINKKEPHIIIGKYIIIPVDYALTTPKTIKDDT